MAAKSTAYTLHLEAPMTPEEPVSTILALIRSASMKKGDGGSFVSHLGNKQCFEIDMISGIG